MLLKKITITFLVNLVYFILMCIGKTSRNIFINHEIREKFENEKTPIIYTLWHNRLLYLPPGNRGRNNRLFFEDCKGGVPGTKSCRCLLRLPSRTM